MIAIRFCFNPYYAQFALRPGQLLIGRWQVRWGRNAFNQF